MSTTIARLYNWVTDKAANVKITASKMDAENDQIITALNRKVLCSASAPGSPIAGQTWFDTTNKYLKVYRNNEWCIITVVHVGTSAPSTVQEGDVWYDTTNDLLKAYNGTSWLTIGPSMTAILGSYKNLKVVRDSATQVTVTADELILKDSSSVPVLISSVSEAIAITTSGASGLDTGSEGSSRWYYIWIIRKSSDGTVNGLLSESSSSPTMPSGYDQKALVSAVRNDGSSNFIDFIQEGRNYTYKQDITAASGNVGSGAWVSIDTTSLVPSALSTICSGLLVALDTNITNDNTVSTSVTTESRNKIFGNASTTCSYWRLHIFTANTLWWMSTSAANKVYFTGFEINKL